MTWLVMAAISFFLLLATGGAPTQAQQDPYSGQPDASVAQQGAPQQQQGAPPPAASSSGQPYATETPQQLQQLVAPIALYPDSLAASILAASSDPAQITDANNWLASRRNLQPQQLAAEADKQPWDPSVKALLPFPPVLQNMASNLSWTSELGDAYYNQQTDVMNAIQGLRQQAKKAGTLESNAQIKVTDSNGYISIDPANINPQQTANPQQAPPQTVYIPSYDPWAAYGYPIAPWPGWWKSPAFGGMAPACILDRASASVRFGAMAGDGRCGASIGTVTACSSIAGPTSREARHFSIAITTIEARPVLPGLWRRTADTRAASSRRMPPREFAPAPLADTTMAAT